MGLTLANINIIDFQKYLDPEELRSSYAIEGVEPTLILGPTKNWKICYNPSDKTSTVEIIPPYIKKVPNVNPMIVDMVDSNMKNVLIEFQDGSRIVALKLYPNPESLSISSSKIVNRYTTMTRWVEEHWGDDLDTINFSGSTYSFNALINSKERTGLTSVYRNYSESYKYLKTLIDIYRTNGYLYQEPNSYTMTKVPVSDKEQFEYFMVNRFLLQNPRFQNNHPRHGMIRERLYIRISFDYVTFLGYFESFDITEEETNPYRLNYSSVYKAEKTIWTVGV